VSVTCSALTCTAYLLIDDSVTGDSIHLLLKITVPLECDAIYSGRYISIVRTITWLL